MKVSVILATYNRLELLKRALDSYFNQEYKNKELIIIANGCTDGTNEYLKKFDSVKNVKVIVRQVNNITTTFNELWANCTGDVICQLHDDDELTENSLSLRINEFNKNKFVEVVWGGVIQQDINRNNRQFIAGYPPNPFEGLKREYINFTSLMWKNSIKEKFMIDPQYTYSGDSIFKVRCLMECCCASIEDAVMYYTIHAGQETKRGNANGEMAIENELVKKEIKKIYSL